MNKLKMKNEKTENGKLKMETENGKLKMKN
jgi:hypothetical protein